MRILVSAPSKDLSQQQIDSIYKDLEKIDRRLADWKEDPTAEVRINKPDPGAPTHEIVMELHYGRNHLIAKEVHADVGQGVRAARDDLIRQINDRSRGGHSSFAKGL